MLADIAGSAEALSATEAACRAVRPDTAISTVTFNVTDAAAVTATLSDLSAEGVVADLLVNNAGYQGQFASILDAEADDIANVMAVNVLGVIHVLQAFAQMLVAKELEGTVVNLASMAGVNGAPNMAAYSASKAAVIGVTKSAAKDLAPHGIRVNAVSPGFIGPGRMWDNQVAGQAAVGSQYFPVERDAVADQMIGQVPMRRFGSLDEVADVVLFLLSDSSTYVTGTNTEISGGAA